MNLASLIFRPAAFTVTDRGSLADDGLREDVNATTTRWPAPSACTVVFTFNLAAAAGEAAVIAEMTDTAKAIVKT